MLLLLLSCHAAGPAGEAQAPAQPGAPGTPLLSPTCRKRKSRNCSSHSNPSFCSTHLLKETRFLDLSGPSSPSLFCIRAIVITTASGGAGPDCRPSSLSNPALCSPSSCHCSEFPLLRGMHPVILPSQTCLPDFMLRLAAPPRDGRSPGAAAPGAAPNFPAPGVLFLAAHLVEELPRMSRPWRPRAH